MSVVDLLVGREVEVGCRPAADAVRAAVKLALAEDLGERGDLSASLVEDREARGLIVCRGAGVLAGQDCATEAFRQVDEGLRVDWFETDGSELRAGQKVATIGGRLRSVLTAERTALNFLCHLSGVASLTRRCVDAASAFGSARILDTRKTTPGLRVLEKAAVRAGGGLNHRMSLSDMVMFKDNHIAASAAGAGSIAELVAAARELLRDDPVPIEVECDTLDQVVEAVGAGADLIMVDNMAPDEVVACVQVAAGRCRIEVSGGVSLETVGVYSATGADFISMGGLTHSAPALDLSLEVRLPPDAAVEADRFTVAARHDPRG